MSAILVLVTARNAGLKRVTSLWRVQPARLADFRKDPVLGTIKGKALPVTSVGLVRNPSDKPSGRDGMKPVPELKLTLPAFGSEDIALVIDVDPKAPGYGPGAVALFALVEERNGKPAGGMLVMVTGSGTTIVVPTEDLSPNPLPIAVQGPYFQAGQSYDKATSGKPLSRVSATDTPGFVGFLCRNDSKNPISQLVLYPESISLPYVAWTPAVFEIEVLAPGERFFAAFPFDAAGATPITGKIRLVGYGKGFTRTRFDVGLEILERRG